MSQKKIVSFVMFFLLFYIQIVFADFTPPQAAIASQHPLATQAGVEIIEKGGNAFDAAVAISAMLAVVEPYHSGLGGGGFWLLHVDKGPEGQKELVVDGREMAPAAAEESLYLSDAGRVRSGLLEKGPLSAAIPGEPAALAFINQHYGKLSLATCLAPAIMVAKTGFTVNEKYRYAVMSRKNLIKANPVFRNIIMPKDQDPEIGDLIVQPDLAEVLSILAKKGHDGFYKGTVAKKLVLGVKAAGGVWALSDLENYKIRVHKPIDTTYHGMKVITIPPPSSGGVILLSTLNILEKFEMDPLSAADKNHLIIESLRRAHCDSVTYLGDPDYVNISLEALLSKAHAEKWRDTIDLNRATPSDSLSCGVSPHGERNTSHFSILDTEGNRVSATLSINHYFGSVFMPPSTGIILNNEMDDFLVSSRGTQEGKSPNRIQPKKRPLSTMTPTFIETEVGVGALGTPGGNRIPAMVLLAVLDAAQGTLPASWVQGKRFYHQYLPDVVSYETNAFDRDMQNALRLRGHRLEAMGRYYGNMQAVFWDQKEERVFAASDRRGLGKAQVF